MDNTITIENNTITTNNFNENFEFKIAHITDLHNDEFGKNNINLINKLKNINPNIIVITGDLIDSRRTSVDISITFIENAINIAPIYYVSGNHEARVPVDYRELEEAMINLGVAILNEDTDFIIHKNDKIQIIGIDDPTTYTNEQLIDLDLKRLNDNNLYTILLSHRPELFDLYVENDIDLVFTGHAHGGQFRLPFIGGIIAPNQGFLPKYDKGIYTKKRTTMILSAGLGNSIFPFRINNPPEIVVTTIKGQK